MKTEIRTSAKELRPDRSLLRADAVAGLTFAIVNVPQAMAHAYLAAVNPVLGIYTLMVAVPVGAIFSSSVYMNVSTTGALSVAAGDGLAGIPVAQRMQALAALVFLVGVIQVLAGLFRLGFILRFVSNSVMTGFLNGVAVLIILGQLGDLTGFRSRFSNNVLRAFDLALSADQIDISTTIIGGLTIAVIVLIVAHTLAQICLHNRDQCRHGGAHAAVDARLRRRTELAGNQDRGGRCGHPAFHACAFPCRRRS